MDKQAYEHIVGMVLSKGARFVFDPAGLINKNVINPVKGQTTNPPTNSNNIPNNPVSSAPPGMSASITIPKLGSPELQNIINKYRRYPMPTIGVDTRRYPMPNVANEQEYKRMYPNAIGTYAQDKQLQSLAKSFRPTLNPPLKSPFMQ